MVLLHNLVLNLIDFKLNLGRLAFDGLNLLLIILDSNLERLLLVYERVLLLVDLFSLLSKFLSFLSDFNFELFKILLFLGLQCQEFFVLVFKAGELLFYLCGLREHLVLVLLEAVDCILELLHLRKFVLLLVLDHDVGPLEKRKLTLELLDLLIGGFDLEVKLLDLSD